MGESGGDVREQKDKISLLSEELMQLSVKGSKVVPDEKPTLICTIWTGKLYNPESFKAQMRSVWKTKKKFEIQLAGQNLYLIVFELEEDLELIMEGRPWLFRKSLILFDRLTHSVERSKICLNSSLVWLKIGPCLPEFDKKDLLHAIGVTFGGVIRSEISGEWCRLKINLNYEKLPLFYFGCGRMGHGLPDCSVLSTAEKDNIKEDPPHTMALKVESKFVGKEVIKFNDFAKKDRTQCSYTGDSESVMIEDIINREVNNLKVEENGRSQMNVKEEMLKNQVDVVTVMTDLNMVDTRSIPKRKATEGRVEFLNIEDEYDDSTKRQKKEQEKDLEDSVPETM
ncbi:hypothetical protein Gotri_011322, partial [Gossypium trilobum]|nr:hypothetical protein [Gossypium trilobum]